MGGKPAGRKVQHPGRQALGKRVFPMAAEGGVTLQAQVEQGVGGQEGEQQTRGRQIDGAEKENGQGVRALDALAPGVRATAQRGYQEQG